MELAVGIVNQTCPGASVMMFKGCPPSVGIGYSFKKSDTGADIPKDLDQPDRRKISKMIAGIEARIHPINRKDCVLSDRPFLIMKPYTQFEHCGVALSPPTDSKSFNPILPPSITALLFDVRPRIITILPYKHTS
jgi:hypothetical protein